MSDGGGGGERRGPNPNLKPKFPMSWGGGGGGGGAKKIFVPNLCQAKSGVFSKWRGGGGGASKLLGMA